MSENSVKDLGDLYDYYNARLFGLELPVCNVNCIQHPGLPAFVNNGRNGSNEINFRPEWFRMENVEWNAQFVHEMVHIWQADYFPATHKGYHNKEWGEKMRAVGLEPSDSGKPGGRSRGYTISQYPLQDGLFTHAYNELSQDELDNVRNHYSTGNGFAQNRLDVSFFRTKHIQYTCNCGSCFEGLPGIEMLCCACNSRLQPQGRKSLNKPSI